MDVPVQKTKMCCITYTTCLLCASTSLKVSVCPIASKDPSCNPLNIDIGHSYHKFLETAHRFKYSLACTESKDITTMSIQEVVDKYAGLIENKLGSMGNGEYILVLEDKDGNETETTCVSVTRRRYRYMKERRNMRSLADDTLYEHPAEQI